ncbi:hypothetical protein ACQKOA_03750 [Bacillus mobilis]|uniref:hypothetical protein n=1 Tax=Bacillus mobilis TaxID=2026190 RepID=UPI003CFE1C2F
MSELLWTTKINTIGACILEELRGEREFEEILYNITDNYAVDLNAARSDVWRYIVLTFLSLRWCRKYP